MSFSSLQDKQKSAKPADHSSSQARSYLALLPAHTLAPSRRLAPLTTLKNKFFRFVRITCFPLQLNILGINFLCPIVIVFNAVSSFCLYSACFFVWPYQYFTSLRFACEAYVCLCIVKFLCCFFFSFDLTCLFQLLF